MITIDIDILNNLKVLKTILGELDEEQSWAICFNATPDNEHWKDYPNKCARYFTFDLEKRVFSWKCHDNLNPSDTTHIATYGHALEFLENLFSIQDTFIDKNNPIDHAMSECNNPDIVASVNAPDPSPPEISFKKWSDMKEDYIGKHVTFKPSWNDYDIYGNPHSQDYPTVFIEDNGGKKPAWVSEGAMEKIKELSKNCHITLTPHKSNLCSEHHAKMETAIQAMAKNIADEIDAQFIAKQMAAMMHGMGVPKDF